MDDRVSGMLRSERLDGQCGIVRIIFDQQDARGSLECHHQSLTWRDGERSAARCAPSRPLRHDRIHELAREFADLPMTDPKSCILIVEDNRDDAAIALRALRDHADSHEIVVLEDGADARDFLNAVGAFAHRYVCDMPDLVLLDLKLPKVGGLEVLKSMRSEARTRAVPVVVLTSSDEEEDIARAYSLGANSYIRKPVNYDAFARAIREVSHYWLTVNRSPLKVRDDTPPRDRDVK